MTENQYLQQLRSFGMTNLSHFKPHGTGAPGTLKRVASYLKDFGVQLEKYSKMVTDKANELLAEAEEDEEIKMESLKSKMVAECKNQFNEFVKMHKPK